MVEFRKIVKLYIGCTPMDSMLNSLASKILSKSNHGEIVEVVCELLRDLQKKPEFHLSSWHPFGFLKLNLGTAKDIGDIRLHIWYPGIRRIQDPPGWTVHKHNWDLTSHILSGFLINEMYEVSFLDDDFTHRIYDVSYDKGVSISSATEKKVSYHLTTTEKFEAGQIYEIPVNKFHATHVPEGILTSTIAITTNKINIVPEVIGPVDGEDKYLWQRSPCEPVLFTTIIEQLLSELQRNQL
jgi:hypothetical protein